MYTKLRDALSTERAAVEAEIAGAADPAVVAGRQARLMEIRASLHDLDTRETRITTAADLDEVARAADTELDVQLTARRARHHHLMTRAKALVDAAHVLVGVSETTAAL